MTSENDPLNESAVAEKSPGEIARPKATLAKFIEDNSKLVTSIAAFVALTAFSSQLDNDIKLYLSSLSLLGAVLLAIELVRQLPPEPRDWLLSSFSVLLPVLILLMGEYWVSRFPAVWMPAVLFAVSLLLFVGLPGLFSHVAAKIIELVSARLFHRQIRTELKTRIEQFGLFGIIGFLFLCWLWMSHRFGGRSITLHFPHF